MTVTELFNDTELVYRDIPLYVEGKPAQYHTVVSQTNEKGHLVPLFVNVTQKEST